MNNLHLVPQQPAESAAPTRPADLRQSNGGRTRPPTRRNRSTAPFTGPDVEGDAANDLVEAADHVDTVEIVELGDAAGGDWWNRVAACAAVSQRGLFAFGTALRLHGLTCFGDYDQLEVLCPKGWNPQYRAEVRLRHTRGLTAGDVTRISTPVGELRVLDLATTLVLLGSVCTESSLDRAVAEALGRGLHADRLRSVAQRWSARGRVGPPLLIRVLDDQLGRRLHGRWFERVATVLESQVGADRVVRDHRVGGTLGRRAVALPVAVPSARVALVERPTAPLQHQLRDRGWSLINVGWRDVDRAELIAARVAMAVDHSMRAAA